MSGELERSRHKKGKEAARTADKKGEIHGGARRCGRTTRMLEAAVEAAKTGQPVLIIASSRLSAIYLRQLLYRLGASIPVLNGSIRVETPEFCNFDWRHLEAPGFGPEYEVLVDHFAIEDRFGKMLEMLHAFDEPESEKD